MARSVAPIGRRSGNQTPLPFKAVYAQLRGKSQFLIKQKVELFRVKCWRINSQVMVLDCRRLHCVYFYHIKSQHTNLFNAEIGVKMSDLDL